MVMPNFDGADVHCPKCGPVQSPVLDSRSAIFRGVATRWRRRQCPKCGERLTTYEISVEVLEQLEAQARSDIAKKLLKEII